MANQQTTTGIDNIVLTTGTDGIVVTSTGEIQAADTLDGGNGQDTIYIASSFSGPNSFGTGAVAVDLSGAGTTGGTGFRNMERLEFTNTTGTSSVILSSAQFGIGLISNTFRLTGTTAATQTVTINLVAGNSSFTTAGWTLVNYTTAGTDSVTINGSSGDNVIVGLTANRTIINAGDGNDQVTGGSANDTFDLGNGNDTVIAATSDGSDTFTGGAGIDVLDYSTVTNALTVTATSVLGNGSDVISGFEHYLLGTGNDTFTGSAADETVEGGDGNDSIKASLGSDSIVGGNGTDSVDYSTLGVALTYNVGQGTVAKAGGGTDTLSGVENINFGNAAMNVVGSTGNDNLTFGSGADSILAGDGNDTIDGGDGSDTIDGGNGNDSLNGGAANDFIAGKAGADSIDGGDGNDIIYIGMEGSNDTAIGGLGNDTIDFRDGTSGVSVSFTAPGTGTATSAGETDSFSGFEAYVLSAFADTFVGSTGNDTVMALGGNDSLDGGDGDDTFLIGTNEGIDTIVGGNGTDTVKARTAGTSINVTTVSGVEVFDGTGFANFRLVGTTGADTIDLTGLTLINVERIDGGAGNDTIIGSSGGDIIADSAGADSLSGGDGNDIFLVNYLTGVGDVINGGNGTDTLKLLSNTSLTGTTLTNIEAVNLNGFALDVRDTSGADLIDFSGITVSGAFAISASVGNDTIIGSAGNETILGGAGADVLTGTGGNDVFRYTSASQSTVAAADHITDFASGDLIRLNEIDANVVQSGVQAWNFIGNSAFTANTPGQLRAYFDGTNTIIEGNYNNDTVADFRIVLDGFSGTLSAADFIL